MMRHQRKMWKLEDLSMKEEERFEQTNKNDASGTRKKQKDKKRFNEYSKTSTGSFQVSNLQ